MYSSLLRGIFILFYFILTNVHAFHKYQQNRGESLCWNQKCRYEVGVNGGVTFFFFWIDQPSIRIFVVVVVVVRETKNYKYRTNETRKSKCDSGDRYTSALMPALYGALKYGGRATEADLEIKL